MPRRRAPGPAPPRIRAAPPGNRPTPGGRRASPHSHPAATTRAWRARAAPAAAAGSRSPDRDSSAYWWPNPYTYRKSPRWFPSGFRPPDSRAARTACGMTSRPASTRRGYRSLSVRSRPPAACANNPPGTLPATGNGSPHRRRCRHARRPGSCLRCADAPCAPAPAPGSRTNRRRSRCAIAPPAAPRRRTAPPPPPRSRSATDSPDTRGRARNHSHRRPPYSRRRAVHGRSASPGSRYARHPDADRRPPARCPDR
ncbi:Uncharacterised protein [Bordetella pertussis]|nr:Uncharacterised protein [Bordetella pertussis]CFM20868.1 Uncharacterised protein [Bordetella pertussis]CFM66800.1 Uncharacterised protein [Bordetella pertussis]CFN24822.1 Uncharacterised protein [Bordetella pertussis]CFN31351.1 Uncharacterised protein [Bordetella pertussis]